MTSTRFRTAAVAMVALAIVVSLSAPSRPALAEYTFEVVKSFALPEVTRGALVVGDDGALYGTTQSGGSSGMGMVFRIDSAGNFTRLHSFSRTDGATPTTALVVGSDGALYGTTLSGGSSDRGTVFRVDNQGNFTSLHSFNGTDGSGTQATLVVGSNGALYGTTSGGGASDSGTVFRIDATGGFTTLHSFGFAYGARPVHPLVVGNDGALYGATSGGYPSLGGRGSFFRVDIAGNVTYLHGFGGAGEYDMEYHVSALVVGGDGAFYGTTTPYYGESGGGTLFRVDAAGNFSRLHSFTAWEVGTLSVVGSDGAIYGTTTRGGSSNFGTVFRVDSTGNFTSLHSFHGLDGIHPSGLVVGSDGALYGTTDFAYGDSRGMVFRIDSAGVVSSLHSFDGMDGAAPRSLVLGGDGALYGITDYGGSSNLGTVFKVDSAGTFTSLHSFGMGGAEDGRSPMGALVRGSDGALYGTTSSGGTSDEGTVFRIDGAANFTSLHSFSHTDGSSPVAALVLGGDGALYGTTSSGGTSGAGTVFRIDGAGHFTTVHSFDYQWSGPLVAGSDGSVYGTTPYDVFRIDNAGNFTTYWSSPSGPLVAGSDGAVYGMTTLSVFRIDSAGTFALVHSFFPGAAYASPGGSFLGLGSDGALYGLVPDTFLDFNCGDTCWGFASGFLFKIDSAGAFTHLRSFSRDDRFYLSSALVAGSDGALYGTTPYGESGYGTIFRIDSDGTFTSVHSFGRGGDGSPGESGGYPSALVLGGDCALYGTAQGGGPKGGGVVYRLFEVGHLCQRIAFDPLPDRTFGDSPFAVSATASSGLPVSFHASGSCSVSGDQVTLTGAGLCTVTASQVGDADYEAAPPVSQSFHVYFDFEGFLPPVEGVPGVNRANAGRVVPIAFALAGDPGPGVLDAALVRRVDCDTLAPEGGFEPAASPGASAPRSAASKGRYAFSWKTEKSWAGSCRELALELVDGSTHRAYFRFEGRHPSPERHGRN